MTTRPDLEFLFDGGGSLSVFEGVTQVVKLGRVHSVNVGVDGVLLREGRTMDGSTLGGGGVCY